MYACMCDIFFMGGRFQRSGVAAGVHVCMYVCMYVCMCDDYFMGGGFKRSDVAAGMYVCMYVCMYVTSERRG